MVRHRKLSVHLEHEFLLKMEGAGLSETEAQAVVEDSSLAERAVSFIRRGGYKATTAQKRARAIMGTNFFGIEEATQHLRVKPTQAQLAALTKIPFTEAELRECKGSHILSAVFPLSILDIRKRVPRENFYSHENAKYNTEHLAKKKGKARWHLILKKRVPNSTRKTWDEQQGLLNENEEVPEARIIVYTIIGHYLATGERLFENVCVRCADRDSEGERVYVGFFSDRDGLSISIGWDVDRIVPLGLASSRKFRS